MVEQIIDNSKFASFVAEQTAKSRADNFQQRYIFLKKPKNFKSAPGIFVKGATIEVDFAQMSDESDVILWSKLAELDWLDDLARMRDQFVLDRCSKITDPIKKTAMQFDATREFERNLCQNSLYYLVKFILGYDKTVFHLHYFTCRTMEKLRPGYRGLRELPRDTYKSTCMVIGFMIQQVLINPQVRILLKSNTEKNASSKPKESRAHFERNQLMRQLFPEHSTVKSADLGSGTKWNSRANTSMQQEGNFTAAGVGSSQTSQHYDIIIGDDFWDQKSVKSPEVMTKCRGEMAEIEYLLAAPQEGKIIFIGTRFAHDDPTTDLLQDDRCQCIIVSGVTPTGRSLFPEQMGLQSFYSQWKKHAYVFSCQVMLNPTADDASFRREWFGYLSYADIQKAEKEGKIRSQIILLTDAAGDNADKSDFVAIMAVNKDSLNRYTVIDYIREKLTPSDFLKRVFSMFDKYTASYVVRQNAPLENALVSFIRDSNRDRHKAGRRIVKFKKISLGKQSKTARMSGLQPYFQQERIFFDPALDHLSELENEILSFPHNMSNDDGMDALAEITDEEVSKCPIFKGAPIDDKPQEEPMHSPEEIYRRSAASAAYKAASAHITKKGRPGLCYR